MITLAVQAGGQSRRMGSDKGLLPFLGRPLIQRVVERRRPRPVEIENVAAEHQIAGCRRRSYDRVMVFRRVRPAGQQVQVGHEVTRRHSIGLSSRRLHDER